MINYLDKDSQLMVIFFIHLYQKWSILIKGASYSIYKFIISFTVNIRLVVSLSIYINLCMKIHQHMKKHLLLISAFLVAFQLSFGQLSGTKTIPGDYATIQAAIAALNAQGVGSGGVTFNVNAGWTETFTALNAGLITATGTASNQIIFQKSGSGTNPMVTACLNGVGSADYVFALSGSDYVTFNGIDVQENSSNASTTTQMEWGYAIFKASATDGAQNNTIKNCNISLNKANTVTYGIYLNNVTAAAPTTQLTVTAISGGNSNNKFYSNNISNVYNGIYLYGYADGTAPFNYYDQGNDVGSLGGNNITNFAGGSGTFYGLYVYYQNNLTIAGTNINGGASTTGTMYGMYFGTSTNASGTISGNNITLTSGGTTAYMYCIYNSGFGTSGSSNTLNITNNFIQNCTYPGATSAYFYGLYNAASALTINLYGNTVTNNIIGGSYYMYLLYSTSQTGGTLDLYNNTISNNQRSGAGTQSGTAYMYCLYVPGPGINMVHDNNIFGNSCPAQASYGANIYSIYASTSSTNQSFYNNSVHDQTINGSYTSSHVMYGMYIVSGSGPVNIYNNNIYNLTVSNTSTGYGYGYGLYSSGGTIVNIYKNRLSNVSMAGTSGYFYGLYISSGATVCANNNFIFDLKAPASTSTAGLYGAYISGGTNVYLQDNTIYLNCASSSTTTFTSFGVYASTTPNVELRNNIIVNTSSAASSSYSTIAYRRSSTTLTSYMASSNNNCLYAGTPGTTNLLYYDGTNSIQTLSAYKNLVSPRDLVSVSELPPFVNGTTSPMNVHLQTGIATQCERGGSIVTAPPVNITSDIDGEPRYPNAGYPDNPSYPATAPDIGADEFGGIPLDLNPPNISFTPFGNTTGTGSRTLTTTIFDPSGVPTTGTGLPVLYWKINSGSWNAATATYVSGSTYTFSFGSGVVLNDIVYYYIVAQDNTSPTPNVGSNPLAGASGFTPDPPACSTPPTTPYSYTIVTALSGAYTVGSGGTYPSITGAGGLFADLNSKVVTGNITVTVIGNLTETGANAMNQITEEPAGSNFTVTIKPDGTTIRVASGSYSGGLIRLNGADNVIFDGRFGGSGNYLTFSNTGTSGSVFQLISLGAGLGSTNVTIRNCNINMGGNASGTYDIAIGGSTNASQGNDNDNVSILNNVLSKAYVGIWAQGTATSNPGVMDNLQIVGNSIGSGVSTDYMGHDGIIVANGNGCNIAQNTIFNIITTNTTPVGLTLSTGFINSTVSRNKINNITYTGTSGYGGRGMYINTATSPSNLTIDNNLIYVIGGDGWSTFSGTSMVGMYFDGSMSTLNIYYNSVYMNGTFSRSSTTVTTAILFFTATITNIDLRNNIFQNAMDNTYGTTDLNYAIYSSAAASAFTQINYNDYYANGPQGMLGYLGGNISTLPAWRTATGKDLNSISADPQFVSTTDLRINLGAPVLAAGTPVSVTYDYTGATRSVSTPSMGAYETGGDFSGPAISYTPLSNTSNLANRTFTPVTITDFSGVNTTSGTRPRVYYKRSTDGNVWNNNTNGTDGWKWVEATGTTSPFTFVIDYSLLNGGTGAPVGTNIQYFVVAQDLQATPLVSINSGTFTAQPTSVALTAAAFPIGGTINSYNIALALTGTINVGAGQTYTSLTNNDAAGLFKAVNANLLTGNVVINIVSDITTETGSVALNQWSEEGAGNYTMTIQPDAATNRTISGSYSGGLIRINGTDRLTIDGRYGGSGNYLTFTNTVTTGTIAAIQVISLGNGAGATGVTIRNCNVSTGFNTTGAYGIAIGGATVATTGADNDNITLMNNNVYKAYVGIWAQGLVATNPGAMDNLQVTGNSIGSVTSTDYIGHDGIYLAYGTGCNISQNTIYNIITTATTPVGLTLSTGFVSSTVSANNINNIVYTSTGGWGARGMYVSTSTASSNLNIINNIVAVVGGDGYTSFSNSSPVGMYFDGTMSGLNIWFNSVYMSGALTYSGGSLTTAILFYTSTITGIDLRNNIFMNSMDNAAQTTDKNYAIYSAAPAGSFTSINFNDYYTSGPQGVLGYFNGSDQTTLNAWKTATGQDAGSQSLDPVFVSTTDLHPTNGAFDNLGTYLTAVPADFSNVSRTNPPDMGAFEFGTNPSVATTSAGTIICDGATLNGTVNANTLTVNTYFDYGLTTSYGGSVAGVPPTVSGSSTTPVSRAITGLIPSTLYHFRIRVVTSGGITSYGSDATFTTAATSGPTATTQSADGIGLDYATLHGSVIAGCNSTTVTFEYGMTTGYGTTVSAIESPVNGGGPSGVSVNLTGLGISTLYHYRVVANNGQGTSYGSDMTFTTGASAPTVITNPATNINYFTAQVNGTVTANNQTTTVTFEWGLTSSYGNSISGIPATVNGASPNAEYAMLPGLTHNTTYHYRCVGQNATGTTYGSDQTFTTLCHLPEAAGTITGPDSLCQATSGHVYSVTAVQFATGYVWSLPPGGTITGGSNTNSITVSYSGSATSGNVTVYATNVCGNGTTSTLPVTVYPLPVPTISGANPACVGSNYQYSTENGMSGYIWTVSAGGTITAGAGTHQITVHWNNTGAQTVSVIYTSPYGCPAASPTVMNVNVSSLPVPTIAGSNTMCEDEGLHVYTTQQGYSNYIWTVTSGGNIVSGQGTYQIEVNWFNAGNQTVTVNYTNASGCYASSPASFAVTVLPKPGPAGAISGPNSLCEGDQGGYSVGPIANADVYVWTVPAGATIVDGIGTNSIKVVFGPGSSGNITVFGSNVCGDGAPSAAYFVTVNPLPATPVVTADANYLLTSSAPAGNQWYFNGVAIDGATDQTYQAEEEGFYWTVVTLNGCTSAESNHVEIIFTGLDELPGTSVRTFPIPNSGQFTISILNQAEQSYDIYVMNNLGVRIYEKTQWVVSKKGDLNVDLGVVSKGIYTLMIQSKENRMVRKIIVSK